jgi:uncharacterized FAD-dependent dehydrogenase
MKSLIIRNREVCGIVTADSKEFMGPVILATGHSARDVYRYLAVENIDMEAKAIAVGVRVEHPQTLIDQIRYHRKEGRGAFLPAAEYSFTAQSAGRGVYSFCMCPGGVFVPSASATEQVVVNGMSPSHRGSRWANAGMVVEVSPTDLSPSPSPQEKGVESAVDKAPLRWRGVGERYKIQNPKLAVLDFQEELERLAWINGGMRQTAPAQRMADFVQRRNSSDLPESSYVPGLLASPLHFWLPEFITSRLRDGFRQFDKVSHGFLTNEAVLTGVETRTSSPVRILRDRETLQHVTLKNLYPCGEGAGYAGGIVSAAIDGENCAEQVAANRSL